MAEEFEAEVCGGLWCNSPRSSLGLSPYVAAINDMGGFEWPSDMKARSSSTDHESGPVSDELLVFRDLQKPRPPDSGDDRVLMDPTLQMMGTGLSSSSSSTSTTDWNQTLLGSGRSESNYHSSSMQQEEMNSRLNLNFWEETGQDSTAYGFKPMNQGLKSATTSQGGLPTSLPMESASYGHPSALLQTLFDTDSPPHQSLFDNQSMNYPSTTNYQTNLNEISPSLANLSPLHRQQQPICPLNLTNSTRLWNSSTEAPNDIQASFFPSTQAQFLAPNFEEKPRIPNLIAMMLPGEVRSNSRHTSISSTDETLIERPIERPTQFTPSHATESSGVGSTSRNVRGPTRGKSTQKLIDNNGGEKIPIHIPSSVGAIVGNHSTKVANELGIQIRLAEPLQGVLKWDDIDDEVKARIIQAARDKFEIVDYDTDPRVRMSINKKCKDRYKDWRARMKVHYRALLKDKVNPYSRPYNGVSKENWTYMIDQVWKSNKHIERSTKNIANRKELPFNHTMGSRSFPAAMSIMASEKDGVQPHIADFFKESHWSNKKNDWVAPICGEKHAEFERLREESSQEGSTPMTQEQMSIEVLGKSSGYLKGFGRPSSSSRCISTSTTNTREMQDMKGELQSLRGLTQTQQDQIHTQQNQINLLLTKQNEMMEMMEMMRSMHASIIGQSSTGG